MAEALRLADQLDDIHTTHVARNAAAELRRLHAENESLRNVANRGGHITVAMSRIAYLEAQCDALLEALKAAEPHLRHADVDYDVYVQCRAAIAAVEGEKT